MTALSACNLPSSAASQEKQAADIQTAAAETVSAQLTENALLVPTATATTAPTNTPEASPTPEATNTEAPTDTPEAACDSIFFVTDVTVPDGTEFAAGSNFTKTWRLRNVGTCTWTTDYELVFDSGEAMGAPASQALAGSVAPGIEVDISVEFTAPNDPGTYVSNWKLRNDSGVVFGLPGPFYTEIIVNDPGSTSVELIFTDFGSVRSNGDVLSPPNTGDLESDVGSHAFVSFDISGIPAGATIDQVRVDFSDYDTLGDPFTELGCLRGYTGSFFPMDAGDYFVGSPLGASLRWCDTGELSDDFLSDDVRDDLQSVLGDSTLEYRIQFNETETNSDGIADMVRLIEVKITVTYTEP
jgi:hypothetical protein